MKNVLYPITSVIAFLALAYKLRDLRKDPRNPALRSLCVTFAVLAFTMALAVPEAERFLERTSGILFVWTIIPTTLCCVSLQATVLFWTYPAEQARPKVRRRMLIMINGAVLVLIAVLVLCPPLDPAAVASARSPESHDRLFHGAPYMGELFLIDLAIIGYTEWDLAWQCLRYRRLVDRRWLRRGLGFLATGALACLLGFCLTRAAHVIALRYFDLFLAPVYRIGPLFLTVSTAVMLFGWTMPAWGQRFDRFRAYHQLGPLWSELSGAAPEVVLRTTSLGRPYWWPLLDMDFRLYRRVIEILDCRLTLRPYLNADIAAMARQRSRAAGLTGQALCAYVEAVTLAAAIRAKRSDEPAAHPLPNIPCPGLEPAEELIWLTQVARAFSAVSGDVHPPMAQPHQKRR